MLDKSKELTPELVINDYRPKKPMIDAKRRRDEYPASYVQKRLFLLDQFHHTQTSYNLPFMIQVEGKIDPRKLEEAFRKLIQRHEILRTSYAVNQDKIIQRIEPDLDFHLKSTKVPSDEVDRISQEFIRPFDLTKAPLFRAELLQLSETESRLLVDMHHSISDATSIDIFNRELVDLYAGNQLPELKMQYKDYGIWENEFASSDDFAEQEKFWLNKFSGTIPVLAMPLDFSRPNQQTFLGNSSNYLISPDEVSRLNQLAFKNRVTLNVILVSVYSILLTKYSGQEDLIIGTAVNSRQHPNLKNVIGMFANTVPLRIGINDQLLVLELVKQIAENIFEASLNQDYPFDRLIEKLQITGERSHNPLIDTMFVFHTRVGHDLVCNTDGLKFSGSRLTTNTALVDLVINAYSERDGSLTCGWQYNVNLLKRETIDRMAGHFQRIIKAILANPTQKLFEIEMLTPEEKQYILYDYNATEAQYPKHKMIHELFEEQAQKTPDKIAIMFQEKVIRYGELHKKSNQVAHYLMEQGIGRGEFVGVLSKRGIDTIVNILGIIKSGAAYIPVDPDYPEERRNYILTNSNCKFVLEPEFYQSKNIMQYSDCNIEGKNCPDNIAYVIYTSGSTGKPKGVVITHQAVVNTIVDINRKFNVTPKDRIIGLSSLCFDLSVYDIFGALSTGATLVLVSDQRDMKDIIQVVEKYEITFWNSVPAIIDLMIENLPRDFRNTRLRMVLLSGDWIPLKLPAKIKEHFPLSQVISLGGATEVSIWSIYYEVNEIKEEWKSIPYGRPLANQQFYVLDKNMKLAPLGVLGELYIGGVGLALGYLNDEAKTGKAFIKHPDLGDLYKTGDYGMLHPEGYIEFLGRLDNQVKIRGFRIELGEIETRLLKHEVVKEAVVIARDDGNRGKYLCAYLTGDRELTVQDLRAYLAEELPDYMIPLYFIQLAQLPLTPNGKVDRKALPEPKGDMNTGVEYVAPRNEIEETLAKIWRELLGVNKIGINDNFYTLGGDSLKAISVLSVLRNYKLTFEMKHLFSFPVIRELAKYVKNLEVTEEQGIIRGEVGLLPAQQRFFTRNYAEMNYWNGGFLLYHNTGFDAEIVKKVFDRIVEHHDALRIVFKFEGERVTQTIRGIEAGIYGFEVFDFSHENNYDEKIKSENRRSQELLDLSNGPLMRVVLYKTGEGDHLFILIHHIVLDSVSIQVIAEDFKTGYGQAVNGAEIEFPPKTVSLREWSEKINEYALSKELLAEIEYWSKLEETDPPPLPRDLSTNDNTHASNRPLNRKMLSVDETERLLKIARQPEGIELKTALLTALGLAIHGWTGQNKVMLCMISHGRDNILAGIDISRTVGWFSNSYPVLLDISTPEDVYNQAIQVQKMVKNIPNNGFGYDILRYLTGSESGKPLNFKLWPEISFNYWGDFRQNGSEATGLITPSRFSPGLSISPNAARDNTLILESGILEGILYLRIQYNRFEYKVDTIVNLFRMFRENLLKIIEHCKP